MKFRYFGGPLDGQILDAEQIARESAVLPYQEGDVALPVQVGMVDGTYYPDYNTDPPSLVWCQRDNH